MSYNRLPVTCFQYLIFLITLIVHSSAIAHNRIATEADRNAYGSYIIPGDLIIDSPTKKTPAGNEVNYYFMAKQWPGLREGGTIWIDGKKLGRTALIKFSNSSSAINPWHVSKIRIKNIPATQVITGHFFCQGIKHLELDGVSNDFPGLSAWPKERKFLTGSFGFHVISKLRSGHGYSISVIDGGTIIMKGFEVQHGFSGVRINHGDHDLTIASIDISNFYVHDTGEGEGFYIGATHKPPLARISNLKISNGIITRTAAEAIQVQHLVGGADIHHVIIRGADVGWMNAFQPGQDTGIQWSIDAGVNKLHHVIVDGFGSVGLVPFGSELSSGGGESHVSEVLFNDGIDVGIYLHKSGSYGIEWNFEDIYYANMKEDSNYARTGRPVKRHMISSRNGKDRYMFRNIRHDQSKEKVFQKTDSIVVEKAEHSRIPEPEYVNSGFHENASRIKQWHPFLAKHFPASQRGTVQIPTCWQEGDIAIETNDEYGFYRCLQTHESNGETLSASKFFTRLTWDANGIRSDQKEWNSNLSQSNFPPDDLRLKPGSFWAQKGYGLE